LSADPGIVILEPVVELIAEFGGKSVNESVGKSVKESVVNGEIDSNEPIREPGGGRQFEYS